MTSARSLSYRSPMAWVIATVTVAFLLLGLRTLLFPASAAAFYGVPTAAPEALAFVQAYGARNIALSLLAAALLVLDFRQGIVALLALAGGIAALDAWIVTSHSGIEPALKHFGYIVVLSGLSFATAWSGQATAPLQRPPA